VILNPSLGATSVKTDFKSDLKTDFKSDKAFTHEAAHLEKKELSPEHKKGLGTKIKELFTGHE